jgi:hypothetical protein
LFCFCLDDIVLFDLINVFFLFLLLQVHDLHEDAIVRLLRYVITKSSVQYEGVDGLLQMIVATPYNGSFLRKNMHLDDIVCTVVDVLVIHLLFSTFEPQVPFYDG